jgi:hypothetical protein
MATPQTKYQVAEELFPEECPNHGESKHVETRYSLAIRGDRGEYEPAEEWEVEICDGCGREVKPEIDWSNVMDDLPN